MNKIIIAMVISLSASFAFANSCETKQQELIKAAAEVAAKVTLSTMFSTLNTTSTPLRGALDADVAKYASEAAIASAQFEETEKQFNANCKVVEK